MDLIEYAKNEIELLIASKKYNNADELREDKCIMSNVLTMLSCMCDDRLSRNRMSSACQYLMKLLNEKPLTPLEDTENMWIELKEGNVIYSSYRRYRHRRYKPLTKTVYSDGTIEYYDSEYTISKDSDDKYEYNRHVNDIIIKLFPISMPYLPSGPIIVDYKSRKKISSVEDDLFMISHMIFTNGYIEKIDQCFLIENDKIFEVHNDVFYE